MHRSYVAALTASIVTLGVLSTCFAGCGAFGTAAPYTPPAARPSSGALLPVQLPDLSRSPAAVRRQLEAAYDRLQPITSAPDASRAERADAMGQMGGWLMAAGYYDAAERCFQHARHLRPDDARWTYLLGHLHRFRHEPALAAVAFEAALRLRPDDTEALMWLGHTYAELGQPVRAKACFERAAARLRLRGVTPEFEQVARLAPDASRAWRRLAP